MSAPDPYSSFDPLDDEIAAGPGIRFGARLIDYVLLILVVLVIGIATGLSGTISGSDTSGLEDTASTVDLGTILLNVASALIVVAYFAFFESFRGQTVGKMVLRIRTVGPDGRNPTMEEAFRRSAWYLLAALPFFGTLAMAAAGAFIGVTIAQSDRNIGWHDRFAGGTRVLRLG